MNKHTIARAAVSAGLAVAMTLGSVAPATMAWADEAVGPNDSITITNDASNTTSYDGFQILTATVNPDGTASNLAWNDAYKATVLSVLHEYGFDANDSNAQDAVEFMNRYFNSSKAEIDAKTPSPFTGDRTKLGSGTLGEAIATALKDATPTKRSFTGNSGVLSQGWWLFLTDANTVKKDSDTTTDKTPGETFTSPIFALVGGTAKTVDEKTNVPTVTKRVKNDASRSDWSYYADSQMGQQIDYKLEGTVASNIATYDKYFYKFTDSLSAGLTADTNSVKVYAVNNGTETEIDPSSYTKDYDTATNVLTVSFTDLKSAFVKGSTTEKATINADTTVRVTYQAKLDTDKASKVVVGGKGNRNEVTLTYSNNPQSTGTGTSVPSKVRDYTYKLNLLKVDQGTERALQGAKFYITASTPDEGAGTTPQYVQANGSLDATEHDFETNATGYINVSGLDAGTYTVHEVSAPSRDYSTVPDFTFTISATAPSEQDADSTNVSVTTSVAAASSSNSITGQVIAGTLDGNAGDNTLSAATNSATTNDGTVNVVVGNKKSVGLPLTGQAGIGVTLAVGGVVLALGVYRVVRSRREQDAE
ncbi:SpaA isopeptide-forming pilin-related protein [Parafannyhessea sp. LCP21S3_E6]|uniref:SpaA isopeptide-forming pilin-related protein n=1 Tax=unclassified Parafannyhessea TaxID=2847323 RepID=UPI003F9BECDB